MMDSTPKSDEDSTLYFSNCYEPRPRFMIFIAAYELSYVISSQFAKGIDCVN